MFVSKILQFPKEFAILHIISLMSCAWCPSLAGITTVQVSDVDPVVHSVSH